MRKPEQYVYRFRVSHSHGYCFVDVTEPLGRPDKAWAALLAVLKARDKQTPGLGLIRVTNIERTN